MDELPREARQLLALAADAHDPHDPLARDRVRRGVALALAAGAGVGAAATAVSGGTASAKAGFLGSAAKLWIAGGAIVVGAAAVTVPRLVTEQPAATEMQGRPRHHGAAHVASAPAEVTPADEAPAGAAPDVPAPAPVVEALPSPRATPRARAHAVRHSTEGSSLAAEMALLRAASNALDARDVARAQKLLVEHRARFAHGQLSEEREGLRVLSLCVAGERRGPAEARAFLRTSPDAVLAARIASACKPESSR